MKRNFTDMDRKIIDTRTVAVLKALPYRDGVDLRVDSVRLARFFGFTVEEEELLQHEDGSGNVSILRMTLS